jgi:hypothetical protein
MNLTNEQIYEGELAKLRAEIDRLKAIIVSDTHVLLSKRPVAFRVPRCDPATGGATVSATEWRLFNDESSARSEAEATGVEYQGLYARNGK